MSDLDALDYWLELNADLLDSAVGMLQHTVRFGRSFTEREADNWQWAMATVDERAARCDQLIAGMTQRKQLPWLRGGPPRRLPWVE